MLIDRIHLCSTTNNKIKLYPLKQCFPTWGPRPTRGQFDCYGRQFEYGLDLVACICVLFLFISVLEAYNTFSRKKYQMEKICYFAVGKMCQILYFILISYFFFTSDNCSSTFIKIHYKLG